MIKSAHTIFSIIRSHEDSTLNLYVSTVEFFVRRTEE